MKKRIFSTLLALCMLLCLMPTAAFAEDSTETPPVCSCETACTTDNMNTECPVCGAENAIPQNCGQYIPVEDRTGENSSTERADDPNGPTELSAADQVQAMIDGLPNAEEITEDNAEEVKAQLEAIDEAKAQLSDEEIDELDMTRYAEAAAALGALAAPMLLANDSPDEQFSLTPGGTYYFDLSGASIPGTANSGNSNGAASLPDTSLHYVPFTYAGTIEAYKLTSAMATTEEYAQQKKYPHSLFVADYAVTLKVNWNNLDTASLIFGKNYASGGVDYTLRAPSVGSDFTGSDDSQRGEPQSNEWDTMLNKNSGYIQNWNKMFSWGQDTFSGNASGRAVRGYLSARFWIYNYATTSTPNLGFRPVLEVLNSDTLGSDGLKVVTLDLNGGKLGGSSDAIQIIVKNGSTFTAPASDGLNRPDENTGSYFMWLGSDGKLYAPGASVPADVTKLTAQFALSEQFFLTPGGRYYFDLSAMNIPGKVNGDLPDSTLHYVPFTYVGTVDAYKLMSEMATTEEYAEQNKYPHSLFVADYAVTHTVSWDDLNTAGLIFGKDYVAGGVDYTLRAPSVGSNYTGSGNSERGVPQSNEWDTMLNKDSGYIQNWNEMYSWGQDTVSVDASSRALRGYNSARGYGWDASSRRNARYGFRPVLEVLNPDTLGSDGLKVVTLDLGGGTLGNSSEDIQIIVKIGSEFTAPASDGLTRPDGDTGSYFMWLGSNGKLYAPGASVPAEVTKLTAQFALSEQFSLKPGDRYYFDLSTMGIPGTVNTGNENGAVSLPDTSLHYVPFTYAGTIEAYKLTSAIETTEEYAQQNKYAHSLFVADYAVTHTVSWNDLDTASLIFGKDYVAGGVGYTLRAPSVGSSYTGSGDSERGTPQSNEWDTMLNKNSGYIQNWNKMYSWGQDVSSGFASSRARRGYDSARYWHYDYATDSGPRVGFRPVLEILNADTLGSDGLKVVTLDLGGGKLGGSSDAIQIIVKNGSTFTAPASGGLTRPDGNTGSYFMWLGSDGKLYAPGANVPAEVTKLTAQFALSEQFSLTPGGTYYFDLSGAGIPGTVNGGLPDNTLHYVPFTYAGTVNAYKLMSEMATTEEYAQQYKYDHSLFIADYNVTHTVSWNGLNDEGLIFGKNYASGGVDYTLRAPSVGSISTGSGDSQRGVPQSNEWDTMLNKNSGYIQNWNKMYSWGQDTSSAAESLRALRGYRSARGWGNNSATFSTPSLGFRPVLEVLNPGTLGSDGMKVVTLALNGGKLGGSSDAIHIIVKNGGEFTAPASGGLTRPAGDTGSYFMWLDSNGNSYAPGASVPADVTALTVQWTAPTYTVTLHTNDGTINNGNVTEYTYGVGATLPTDVTRTGYTFKGWYYNENLTGSPVTAIGNTETGNKEYWAKWEINQYTVTVKPENGEADITITQDYGTPITAPADPTREGYQFNGWDKAFPTTMPAENMTITAKWVVNQYTITFDTAGGSAIASITQDYGTAIAAPADPTREGYTFIGWDKAIPTTMPAENMIITAKWRDIAVPTGEIKIAENGWKSFLNTITFGLFFKDTQMVTVTAADNSGEAVKIEYLLSDKALTESKLAGMTFTTYSAPFSINPDNEYVIYVKLTDTSGNVAYINTNGIVLDATVPVISGIEAGKTYCAAQTVTVTEKYISTVKVNGTEVSLDENSQFALSPASGKQTIVVTDKAGNETRVTVTVNDGHTYEWQSENGQYWQKCKFCNHETAKKDIPTINISGADKVCRTQDYKFSFTLPEGATGAAYGYEFIGLGGGPLTPTVENGLYSGIIKASTYPATENSFKLIVSAKTADGFAFSAEKKVTIQNEHTGGTATCKDKAKCEVCGESYGKLDPNNHANLKHIDAKAATKTSEGNIEYWYCDGCNKYYKDAKATQEITKAQTVTAKLPPKITAGDGAAVTQGEKNELAFTSDASFADFLRVELDGTTLEEKNYTKREGSTIITLNRDFVASLSVGEHTLAIVSKSGTATAKFTVKAKPAETAIPQPTVTPQPTAQPQPTVQPVSPIPRTGDTANPALWFALLIVSGSALAAIFVLRRKANRK